jgi:predicted esterase YcpF (UPF0227 family)
LILYIHGFRTTVESHKAKILKEHYHLDNIFIADHSLIPTEAIQELEKIIETKNITAIIASSLGGYYATYLSEKYNLKTVLINPSITPYKTLTKALGENERQDGFKFIWKEEHLTMLEQFKVKNPTLDNYFLFLQKGDEVLDYRIAEKFYKGSKLIIEEGGNHRFKGFGRFFDDVSKFLKI